MRNFMTSLVVLTIALCVVIYRTVNPLPLDDAFAKAALLISAGEALLYFAGAYLLVVLAASAKGWRDHLRQLELARAQELEFITRRFEQQFSERSQYDPRGAK